MTPFRFGIAWLLACSTVGAQAGSPITGTVVDTDGQPIEKAVIVGMTQDRRIPPVEFATTDGHGRFAIPLRDYLTHPHVRHLEVRAARHVPLATSVNINTLLSRSMGTIALERGQLVQIVVRDRDGRPIEGARVSVNAAAEPSRPAEPGSAPRPTDARGLVRLDNAPQHAVDCWIDADGYYTRVLRCATRPIVVELEPSGFVEGRVATSDGSPVPCSVGAVHDAQGSFGSRFMSPRAEWTPTAEDGTFRIPIRYRAPFAIHAFGSRAGSEISAVSDELFGPATGLRLTTRKHELFLRVARDGRPLGNAKANVVWIEGNSREWPHQYDWISTRTVESDANGNFALCRPIDAHDLVAVRITAPGCAEHLLYPATIASHHVELVEFGTIEGVVRNVDDEPIAGAIVDVVSKTYKHRGVSASVCITGADGKYRLEGFEAGKHTIAVVASGFRPGRREVSMQAGEARGHRDFTLEGAPVSRGRLVGAKPGYGWRAHLLGPEEPAYPASQSSVPIESTGAFRFPSGIPEGAWIYLSKPIDGTWHRTMHRLRRPATLDGAVSKFDHPRVATVRTQITGTTIHRDRLFVELQLLDQSQIPIACNVDRHGAFELQVAPGLYRLAVLDRATGLVLHSSESVRLTEGERREHRIELEVARVDLTLRFPNRISRCDRLVVEPDTERDLNQWPRIGIVDLSTCGRHFELYLPRGSTDLSLRRWVKTPTLVVEDTGSIATHEIKIDATTKQLDLEITIPTK